MEADNKVSNDIYQDDSYLVEIQLLSTIIAVGRFKILRESDPESKKLQESSNKSIYKYENVLDFIQKNGITESHFFDPELKKVFIGIQTAASESPTSDIPPEMEIERRFPGISQQLTTHTDDVEKLMDLANESVMFHKMSETLTKTSEITNKNANEGFLYLQSTLEDLGKNLKRKLYDLTANARDRYDKREERKQNNGQDYIKTGFHELDKDIQGLSRGEEFFVLFARTGVGKAQPLHSKVLTPQGYVRMGNVKVGDEVITGTGEIGIVEEIFPQGKIDNYKLTFVAVNGKERVVECSLEHLWKVNVDDAENYEVLTLKEILEKFDKHVFKVDYVSSKTFKVYPLLFKLKSIEYVGKTYCQCLMIDHPDHTYVTNGGVVTHNTWVLMKMLHEAWKTGWNVAMIEPEMTGMKVGYRFDTLNENFSNTDLTYGKTMSPEEESRYETYIKDLESVKRRFLVAHPSDFGNRVTVSAIEAYCKQNKVDVLGIDGLSYIDDERSKPGDNTTTMLTHISADLMDVSIKLQIPILAVVQSNRENGIAQGGKPQLDNIRDSDGIAYSASMVCSLYKKQNALHICLLKNRNGVNDKTYAYDWDINSGKFAFLGYGDVEDENFGGDTESEGYNSFTPRNSNSYNKGPSSPTLSPGREDGMNVSRTRPSTSYDEYTNSSSSNNPEDVF